VERAHPARSAIASYDRNHVPEWALWKPHRSAVSKSRKALVAGPCAAGLAVPSRPGPRVGRYPGLGVRIERHGPAGTENLLTAMDVHFSGVLRVAAEGPSRWRRHALALAKALPKTVDGQPPVGLPLPHRTFAPYATRGSATCMASQFSKKSAAMCKRCRQRRVPDARHNL
jgi:hypothetical protein